MTGANPVCYRIRINGHLDPAWSAWFDGLAVTQHPDGTTALVGPVIDRAALYGLLGRLRDLDATLLSVERLGPDDRRTLTMPSSASGRRHTPVDRRVRRPTLLMIGIAAVLLALLGRELAHGTIGPPGAAAGFAGGLLAGVVASRIHRYVWDERARRVVGQIDRVGAVLLVALVLATLGQDWLLGHWATGATLTAVGLAASAGLLAGRALGTIRRVRRIAQEHAG